MFDEKKQFIDFFERCSLLVSKNEQKTKRNE